MDEKRIKEEVRRYLTQIALELEQAAAGAKGAASCFEDRDRAWVQVQQMYARLDEARNLVGRFQKAIDDAVAGAERSA